MKLRRMTVSTALALALAVATAGAARAQSSFAAGVHIGPSGRASVDLAFFHSDLAPYGRWANVATYGEVFVPRHHHRHWRPYLYGRWAYTDYGWTWVSPEPFGWATYHYGRWVYTSEYGWVWIPGTVWGPAWVDWQESADYVGWAPLPPTVGYDDGYGLDWGGFDAGADLAPESYVYVPQRSFLAVNVAGYAVPPDRCAPIFAGARRITDYRYYGGRVVDQPFSVARAEGFTGRRVPRYQLADLRTADPRPRFQGNRLALFRPRVTAPAAAWTAERIAARSRTLDAPARITERRGVRAQIAAVRGARAAARYQQTVQSRLAARSAAPNLRYAPGPRQGRAFGNQGRAALAPRAFQGRNVQNQQQEVFGARGRQNARLQDRRQAALETHARQNGRFQAQRQQAQDFRQRQVGRQQQQRFAQRQQAQVFRQRQQPAQRRQAQAWQQQRFAQRQQAQAFRQQQQEAWRQQRQQPFAQRQQAQAFRQQQAAQRQQQVWRQQRPARQPQRQQQPNRRQRPGGQ